MPNYNKVILIGHLGSDPELKTISTTGNSVCNVNIAVTDKYKDQEDTTWVSLTLFGRLAEVMTEYTSKGSAVLVEGRLKQSEWTDQDGNKRSKHYVLVSSFTMLGSKPVEQRAEPPGLQKKAESLTENLNDDIPF